MQPVHVNSSNSSLSNSSDLTASWDWNQHMDKMSSCLSLGISFSEKTFLAFFLVFLGCFLFSSTANGFLFFLTVRYKQLLWQPQYILIKNMSACGLGMSFVTAFVVLSSIVRKQTQIYGCWCIAQFCTLRGFFLTSQMTLALMAVERYIFICHGIHYLRMINTCNVHISMGLIWLVSGAVSFHGGLVLSQIQYGFQQQTSGLLCNAFTIKEHVTFSREEGLLVFGPPSVITTFSILAICYCYGCLYHAALRVSKALKCKNHRANRTVGFYFLMFLLQLAPNISFVIFTVIGKKKAFSCKTVSSIVMPLLIIIPSCINATFLLIWNPEIKRRIFSVCCQKCQSTIIAEVEVFQQSVMADETEEHTCQVEHKRQVERENKATTPLPGYVFPSISD